jgi:hypothetical protein
MQWETPDSHCAHSTRRYSVFDSALDRMNHAKWLFHQEKATLYGVGDVNK